VNAPPRIAPPHITGYEFRDTLGTGGHSVVLRYHQLSERRDVAVKVLTLPGAGERLAQESTKMAQLSLHPNVVPVLFSGRDGDRPYLVMACCPGQDLWSMLKQHGPFAMRRVLRIGVQLSDALAAAHAVGIIHRDVKPANILTDEFRSPRLTDFGIAVLENEVTEGIAVSLPWAPPEVLAGQSGGPRADLYSLGATLWNLLTGRTPFDERGANSAEAMEHRIRTTRAPSTGRGDVPDALERLLQRMLAPAPADRPADAAEVRRELHRIEGTYGGPVGPDDPWHTHDAVEETVHRTAPADDDVHETRTQLRPRPAGSPIADLLTVPHAGRRSGIRRRMPVVLGAVAVVILAVAVAAAAFTPDHRPDPAATPAAASIPQDAGAGGDVMPPGVPAVTATRTDAGHVKFTWSYSAAFDSDTYLWRTGTVNGTAADPVLEVAASGSVCLQVKVIRADGSDGSPEWSPKVCAR